MMYFTGDVDGDGYWGNVAEQHAMHRRHVRNLLVALPVVVVLAVLVHSSLIWIVMFIIPLLLLELVIAYRTRPRVGIPDFRPPATVEIELEPPER